RVNSTWTKTMIFGLANDTFQNDAWVLHHRHLAALFIDDAMNAAQDSIDSPAVGKHFRVEPKSTISLIFVEGGKNFLFAPHFDQFAGLQVQDLYRSFIGGALNKRVSRTFPSALHFVEKTNSRRLDQTQYGKNKLEETM